MPRINVEEYISVHPKVGSAPNPTSTTTVPHYVGETKENALLRYRLQATAIAATAFQINMVGPVFSSTVSTYIQHLLMLLADMEGSWNQVKDPPDPDFRTFASIVGANDDLLEFPAGLLREQARLGQMNRSLLDLSYRIVDKKDGAVQEEILSG